MTTFVRSMGRGEYQALLDAVGVVKNNPQLLGEASVSQGELQSFEEHICNSLYKKSYGDSRMLPGLWDLVHEDYGALTRVLNIFRLSGVEPPRGPSILTCLLAQESSAERARQELNPGRRINRFITLTKRAYTLQGARAWSREWHRDTVGVVYALPLGLREKYVLYVRCMGDVALRSIVGINLSIAINNDYADIPTSEMFDIKVNGRQPLFTEYGPDDQLGVDAIMHDALIAGTRSLYLSVGPTPNASTLFVHPLSVKVQ